jgi:thiamine biosynthesis lipoprotein
VSRDPYAFRSMGVDVLVGGATDVERAGVHELFERWDAVLSRFRRNSELNAVNASPAPTVLVSPLFAQVTRIALRAARATDGVVDPTLGHAIVAAGYDRDFDELADGPVGVAEHGHWTSVRLTGRALTRPPGLHLDLNGVAKALAVDTAVALVAGDGFVSAGGDVAARGGAIVGLPNGGALRVARGGVATSGSTRRRWRRYGTPQHHLLDARTGRPSRSRWREVTVVAGTCLAADVAAKTAFLLDDEGPRWLAGQGLRGRFVDADGIAIDTLAAAA